MKKKQSWRVNANFWDFQTISIYFELDTYAARQY